MTSIGHSDEFYLNLLFNRYIQYLSTDVHTYGLGLRALIRASTAANLDH